MSKSNRLRANRIHGVATTGERCWLFSDVGGGKQTSLRQIEGGRRLQMAMNDSLGFHFKVYSNCGLEVYEDYLSWIVHIAS